MMHGHAYSNYLQQGRVISSSYEIKHVLQDNPESVIYVAQHLALNKPVVLKVLNLFDDMIDEKRLMRFRQEAKLASGLDHSNIVKTLAAGTLEDNRPYIVMELVEGITLRSHLQEVGCLEPEFFKEIFVQLLSGLDYVHSRGFLHRDIKPENILLSNSDGFTLAKLTDFGIAKVMNESLGEQSLTATRDIIGSPAYMSPEQCQHLKLDSRSDIYSLGCVMYECLCGKPPFVSESSLDLMYKQLHEQAQPLCKLTPNVSNDFASLVDRCLQKNPDSRWHSAAELRSALESLTISRRSPQKLLVSASLVVFLLTAVAAIVIWQNSAAHHDLERVVPDTKLSAHRKIQNIARDLDANDTILSFDDFHKAINKGNFARAIQILDRLNKSELVKDRAHVMACYAFYYSIMNDYTRSLEYARDAATLARKQTVNKDEYAYEHAQMDVANSLLQLQHFAETKAVLDELAIRFKSEQEQLTPVETKLSEYLCCTGQYSKAVMFCKNKLKNPDVAVDNIIRFRQIILRSAALSGDNKELKTAETLLLAEIDKLQDENLLEKGVSLNKAAEPFLLTGDWKSARKILLNTRKIWNLLECQSKQDRPDQLQFIRHRALLNLGLGHFDAAKADFTDAMTRQERIGIRQGLPCYFGLAYIASEQGDTNTVNHYMKKALSLSSDEWKWSDAGSQSVDAELRLANYLAKAGDISGAERILQHAKSLPFHNDNQKKQIKVLSDWLSTEGI